MSIDRPLTAADLDALAWDKGSPAGAGLLPAIVQDADRGVVLMLAYMNREALAETFRRSRVVFYSRSRRALWEKGETSGNTLQLVSVEADCDLDTLLVRARPAGPACHRNTPTCFGAGELPPLDATFLHHLERVIEQRIADRPEQSYTARLFARGRQRMAQKVGEEGVEVALAAMAGGDTELVGESADLLFHLLVLLRSRGLSLNHVLGELASRHASR